jgi:hypothetical protein
MAALLFRLPRHLPGGRVAVSGVVAVMWLAAIAAPVAAQPAGPAPVAAVEPTAARGFVCAVPGTASAPAATDRPATGLRVSLGAALGEHAYLLMEAMRAAATSSPDAGAVGTRLDVNTDAIAAAIASVYGDAAGTEFRSIWQRHIDAARAYGDAVRTQDTGARDAAIAALDAFKSDLDAFLRKANPKLDADDEAHAVALHLQQLRAYADGDYAEAYRVAREAYAHMYDLGDLLARAVAQQFPDRFPDIRVAFSPASELRVSLDRLLGEHLVLAAEAMRAAIGSSPDTAAARQALDANADDLSGAIGSVYGDAARSSFAQVWRAHLDAYLAYIDAVAAGDQARAGAARTSLEAYGRVFGEFLAKVNPHLTADAVAGLISHHTQALLAMVDAYRRGDAQQAYAVVGEAYAHMFTVGDALAGAISAQFPKQFKDLAGAPATDTSAHSHAAAATNPLDWLAPAGIGIAALVGALLAFGRPARRRPTPAVAGDRPRD